MEREDINTIIAGSAFIISVVHVVFDLIKYKRNRPVITEYYLDNYGMEYQVILTMVTNITNEMGVKYVQVKPKYKYLFYGSYRKCKYQVQSKSEEHINPFNIIYGIGFISITLPDNWETRNCKIKIKTTIGTVRHKYNTDEIEMPEIPELGNQNYKAENIV
ncbi:MAG TPA: hypothetical protein VHO03_08060 [Ignavibacteriales bacterium]|nr:hypothetical protein [Ignavibacteriales bacterium]